MRVNKKLQSASVFEDCIIKLRCPVALVHTKSILAQHNILTGDLQMTDPAKKWHKIIWSAKTKMIRRAQYTYTRRYITVKRAPSQTKITSKETKKVPTPLFHTNLCERNKKINFVYLSILPFSYFSNPLAFINKTINTDNTSKRTHAPMCRYIQPP